MKKLSLIISGTITYLSLPLFSFAQATTPVPNSINPCENPTGIAAALCSLGGAQTATTIKNIVVLFVVLAVIIALLYLLYGGIKWIMSRGDKTEVESARNHIVAAIVGLVVVFLAIFIISIVLSVFGLNITQVVIPTIGPTPTP